MLVAFQLREPRYLIQPVYNVKCEKCNKQTIFEFFKCSLTQLKGTRCDVANCDSNLLPVVPFTEKLSIPTPENILSSVAIIPCSSLYECTCILKKPPPNQVYHKLMRTKMTPKKCSWACSFFLKNSLFDIRFITMTVSEMWRYCLERQYYFSPLESKQKIIDYFQNQPMKKLLEHLENEIKIFNQHLKISFESTNLIWDIGRCISEYSLYDIRIMHKTLTQIYHDVERFVPLFADFINQK